jgi:hexosaminidase
MADTLEPGTHIMNWRSTELAREAAQRNLKVILTPGAYCYLDYYQDAPPFQPEAIGGYLPLEQVYRFVSMEELDAESRKAVCGVQGNLWAEYIPTIEHAEYMLYPRALALAEIGWNADQRAPFADFRKRASDVCDKLREEGVNTFNLHTEIGLRKEYQTPVTHKALGKKVIYNHPFSPYYPAAGESNLTDGLRGGWTHTDKRWQGFIGGKRFDITIDFETPQTVRSVTTGFMHAPGAEIYAPSAYIISTSNDGENFTEVEKITFDGTDETTCQTYVWKGKFKARYVRIQAPGSAKGGWVFADEVVVK